MPLFQRLLTTPTFADPIKTRQAAALNRLLLIFLAASVVLVVATFGEHLYREMWGIIVGNLIIFWCLWLIRRGHLIFPSLMPPFIMLVVITYIIAIGQGVHDIAVAGYPIIIITAGAFSGKRVASVTAGLTVFCLWGLYAAEQVSWIPHGGEVQAVAADVWILSVVMGVTLTLVYVVIDDLTEALRLVHQRERELSVFNAHLEEEVRGRTRHLEDSRREVERLLLETRQRAADLETAKNILESANRVKSDFLASVSHELRTPLTGVLAYAQILQKQTAYGALTEKQLKAVGAISENSQALLGLINNILELSQIEAGKVEMDLRMVAVEDVCQASLRSVTPLAAARQQTIGYSMQPLGLQLVADAPLLKQMLVNLLNNAVKFTAEGGALGLEVMGDPVQQVVRFMIWDKGLGIAPENFPKLFQAFVQLDSRLAREYAGTGLGLALTRRLAELHGGSISVESEGVPGAGSRFTITLPWQLATTPDLHLTPTAGFVLPAPAQWPRKALTIEDSEVTAMQLTGYLDELEIANEVHARALGVVEKALAARPGVILLDVFLPDESGWNILARLKADPRTRALPVIIISAMEDRARGRRLGADGYLVKPVTREELHEALRQVGPPPGEPWPALVVTAPPARPRVLLADDNPVNLSVLTDYLTASNYEVVTAASGRELMSLAREFRPQVVVLGLPLPGADIFEATRLLRREPALTTTPIIVLTSVTLPGDAARGQQAGASAYLTRPVNLQALAGKIQDLLALAVPANDLAV